MKNDEKSQVVQSSIGSEASFKSLLVKSYMVQIENYFGDHQRAMRFLSGVVSAVQHNPKLLECTPESVINSFMTMAQLQLMPSDVSGEAYVIPYNNNKKITLPNGKEHWVKQKEAQFQLGYQGLVTLFYRAKAKEIIAEIVYEKDEFSYTNGVIDHRPDVFAQDRGKPRGAYVIVTLSTGGRISKVMRADEILEIGKKFSKSFAEKKTPWDIKNDPQLWMWRKTVLKQAAKLVPKNEALVTAIAEDNKDSIIADRLENSEDVKQALTMGAVQKEKIYEEASKNKDASKTDQEPVTEGTDIERYGEEGE